MSQTHYYIVDGTNDRSGAHGYPPATIQVVGTDAAAAPAIARGQEQGVPGLQVQGLYVVTFPFPVALALVTVASGNAVSASPSSADGTAWTFRVAPGGMTADSRFYLMAYQA